VTQNLGTTTTAPPAEDEPTQTLAGHLGQGPPRRARVLGELVGRRVVEGGLSFVAFILLFVVFGIWLGGQFINVDSRLLDIHQNAPILLMSLSALSTLLTGAFDLSIAGVADLAGYLTVGLVLNQHVPFALVLVACIVAGLIVGFINGVLVEYMHMNPFIATLAIGTLCEGVAAVYSGGVLISPATGTAQLPNWFVHLGDYQYKAPSWLIAIGLPLAAIAIFFALNRLRPAAWGRNRWIAARLCFLGILSLLLVFVFRLSQWLSGISWLILVLLAAAFSMWVLYEHTTFGRHVRAIGSNRDAAALVGLPVRRQVMKSFMLGGALAALAGVAFAATQGSAQPSVADPDLLTAFAGAFLSTVILSRGRFTVPGTILGGVFVVWIGTALILGGVSSNWTDVVNGAILVMAVGLATVMRRRA
jgi:ribose/xylose/arabinose/galactoside ABC-type transport system permease subunit